MIERTINGSDLFGELINGDERNDLINGHGIADVINGLGGNDILNGGSGDDVVNGGSGDDVVNGGDDDDILNGGTGNDLLLGGKGRNELTGGEDSDTFAFSSTDFRFGEPSDRIVDFNTEEDRLAFTLRVSEGRGITQENIDQFVIVGESSVLFEGIEVATFENRLEAGTDVTVQVGDQDFQVTVARRLTGDDDRETLRGSEGRDSIEARGGNDIIEGRGGGDILTGGAGNDTFFFRPGSGLDFITDYNNGADILAFQGYGFGSFSALRSVIRQEGNDTIIELDAANAVTLLGVSPDDLNENNVFTIA